MLSRNTLHAALVPALSPRPLPPFPRPDMVRADVLVLAGLLEFVDGVMWK